MRPLYVKRQCVRLLISCLMLSGAFGMSGALAQEVTEDAQPEEAAVPFVDGIAAVINQNVITLRQLDQEVRNFRTQLEHQDIPVPDHETLQRQVLQRMISQELQRQEAVRLNVVVTDEHVEHAVHTIAQRNNLTTEQLRHEIESSGLPWDAYLNNLRQEVQLDMLRQRAVDNTIFISDAEVEAFLRTEGRQMNLMPTQRSAPPQHTEQPQASGPSMLGIAQILVQVPESASQMQVDEFRQKAEALLARVQGGADFAGVAASSSDGPNALEGGNLGIRPVEGWPELFIEATRGLAEGQVSGIIRSGNGFHILKVLTLRSSATATSLPAPAAPGPAPQQPSSGEMLVTQTHARHILIKPSQVVTDEQAQQRLLLVRERLRHGEDFAELARHFSEDTTAPLGGDLGWLTPGETVPAFEQAMNMLQPGQISEPVHSQFGWHLIQVIERRTRDMEDEFKRMQARQILFQRRVEPALEDWLSQLRGQAYIENRLDPSDRNRR